MLIRALPEEEINFGQGQTVPLLFVPFIQRRPQDSEGVADITCSGRRLLIPGINGSGGSGL